MKNWSLTSDSSFRLETEVFSRMNNLLSFSKILFKIKLKDKKRWNLFCVYLKDDSSAKHIKTWSSYQKALIIKKWKIQNKILYKKKTGLRNKKVYEIHYFSPPPMHESHPTSHHKLKKFKYLLDWLHTTYSKKDCFISP